MILLRQIMSLDDVLKKINFMLESKQVAMSQYKTIRRYALLIEIIDKYRPSFEKIMDCFRRHGFNVSNRTIQRDIQYIRTHFGIDIIFHTDPPGYYIDRQNSPDLANFLRFIELAKTAAIIVENIQESKKNISYMDFESDGSLRGYEMLEPLLHAIKNHRVIGFAYEKYKTSEHKAYVLQPLLLKEFQNRWYLVGVRDDIQMLRVFGVDRISELEIHNRTFKPKPGFNPLDMFRHTIGINTTENKPEFIELSFSSVQGKYVKALPWHYSQKVTVDNANELRVELFVNPNLELKQRIMATGAEVKVLKPQWLVEDIKKHLKASLNRYEAE